MARAILGMFDKLTQKSANEFAGPCPWCGGEDRFIVWPDQGSGGRYLCRQCEKRGDAIDVLRSRGKTFQEARSIVNEGGKGDSRNKFSDSSPPNRKIWATAAKTFVDRSVINQNQLWSEYLQKRFLTHETALQFGIGWNPSDLYVSGYDWGLQEARIRIPAGLVIPIHRESGVTSLKIRQPNHGKGAKYWQVKGGGNECLLLGTPGLPVLIVESELDAYLIFQEAKHLVSVVAIGGTHKPMDQATIQFIESASRILISTDFDQAEGLNEGPGQKAFGLLKKIFPTAEYLPPALGKDPCEMCSMGVPIDVWIKCGLELDTESKESSTTPGLPHSYPGNPNKLFSDLSKHRNLVPCPKASTPWYWIYRSSCENCSGHIHCLKDLTVAVHTE